MFRTAAGERVPHKLAGVTVIETPRLLLRRFTTEDAGALADLHGDPRVMAYIDDGKPVPRDVTVGRSLPEFLEQYARLPAGLGRSAVVERSAGSSAGSG
jgi:RimJ/RimL family protein N-acetyltransferase